MKLLTMIFSAIFGFFSMFLPISERTDWIINGEYQALETQEKTFQKLMELAESNNTEEIYQVFSQTAKNENRDLWEKVTAFVQFVQEDMTSYEVDGSSRYHKDADHGMIVERRDTDLDICDILRNVRTLFCNEDHKGPSGLYFSDIGQHLGEDAALGGNGYHRNPVSDQGNGSVL